MPSVPAPPSRRERLQVPPLVQLVVGAFLGALAGFLYAKFVGCRTGSCPLTSNPLVATLYGGVVGALLAKGSLGS